MIIGHSLGGGAAAEMAAELDRSGVPVELLLMLDPVGWSEVPANVRRPVIIRPTAGEDHFSVIAAHEREIVNYVLGVKGRRRAAALKARAAGRHASAHSAGAFCSRATRLLDVGLDFGCERSVAVEARGAVSALWTGPRGWLTWAGSRWCDDGVAYSEVLNGEI